MDAHTRSADLLRAWPPPDHAQTRLRGHLLQMLAAPQGLRRGVPEHVTGSCLVLDEDGTATLLVHHAKGGFWVQPGGHWEPSDTDVRATALREATEETGLDLSRATAELVDVHRHRLPATFGTCRVHDDVLFAVRTVGRPAPTGSLESNDIAWFDLDALPAGIVPDLPGRLRAYSRGAAIASAAWTPSRKPRARSVSG